MPAFNAEAYIQAAIQSVLDQTFQDWELVVVNDNSTDDTEAFILSFDDPRIRYFKPTSHFGKPSAVKNHGSLHARGEFLFFFDSDDLLTPDALESMAAHVRGKDHLSAAYGFLTHIDAEGKPLPFAGFKLVPHADGYTLPKGYSHTWSRIATLKFVATPNILVRKHAFARNGGFDETLAAAEDIHLYLKLFLESIDCVGIVPSYVVQYRQHQSSLTKSTEKIEGLLNAHLEIAEQFFADPRLPDEFKSYRPFALCKGYNYVAGVRLSQGDRKSAFALLARAAHDPRIGLVCWLKVCNASLVRCLLPTRLDFWLKSLAVECRDGLLLNRLNNALRGRSTLCHPQAG
jgi:glycosyltransferase involved in cell wall biosynthesis